MKTLYTNCGDHAFIASNYLWHNGHALRIDCSFARALDGTWRYVGTRVGKEYANAYVGNEAYKFDCKAFSKTLAYTGFNPMLNLKAVTAALKKFDYAAYVAELVG